MKLLTLTLLITMVGCAYAPRKESDDAFVERVCVELGNKAKRGQETYYTKAFEAMGCCYNDGLREPKGC